jgi:glycosyltransferase involved in cell wall biosynthesis
MKVLFINHDTSEYGASRSLELFLKNIPDWQKDMVVHLPLVNEARKRFGDLVDRIYGCPLPLNRCWVNRQKHESEFDWYAANFGMPRYKGKIGRLVRWVKEKVKKELAIYELIKRNNYDLVHVNSLHLHQVVRRRFPFVLHIREVYDGSNAEVYSSLKSAKGLIYIDQWVKKPFGQLENIPSTTIINPVDMSCVNMPNREMAILDGDITKHVIFAIIGQINTHKGVPFVIQVFERYPNPNARLLVVGDGGDEIKKKNTDNRIIFTGHLSDLNDVYKNVDYVLRGEKYQAVGRTMLEALYAGCELIVPGDPDVSELEDLESEFKGRVHFYKPREEESLSAILQKTGTVKTSKVGLPTNNLSKSIPDFKNFLLKCSKIKSY